MGSDEAILLIEPDSATRELYRRELSSRYRVLSRPDAVDALALLHTQNVCAIVVEPALPEQWGWDFVGTLQAIAHTRRIPVIVCTVLDERRRGLALGASAYLVKPVLPVTLLETLRRIIEPGEEHAADAGR